MYDDDIGSHATDTRPLMFALVIRRVIDDDGPSYTIDAKNDGIADGQVICMVEAWTEQVRKKFKESLYPPS